MTISKKIVDKIQSRYGAIYIDRFATASNKIVTKFNSYFYEPGCSGTDAFAQSDWGEGISFVNPPLSLMSRTVHFIREYVPKA